MAVRNIGGIDTHVWVPPTYSALFKLTVTRADGTVDDITNIASFKLKDGVTDSIGNFEFSIPNVSENYTSIWTGMEVFKYYCDYATTATTIRFLGRCEKIAYRDNNVVVSGRSEALFLMEKNVNEVYISQDAGAVIIDIITTYGGGRFTTTNVTNPYGTNISLNFNQKPFFQAIQEICELVGADFYIDASSGARFFEKNTVRNTTDAMVHEYNIFEVSDFADDLLQVKNKIRVIGATIDGVQVFATAKDQTSITAYGERNLIIQDDSVEITAQAQEKADFVLAEKKIPPKVGEISSIMLATLQPGENLLLSDPANNLPPQYYRIISFEQSFDRDGDSTPMTVVSVERETIRMTHLMKQRVEIESLRTETSNNPYDLDNGKVFLFDSDEGIHSSTQIINGVLKPTTTNGTWTSGATPANSNITDIYLLPIGETLTGASFFISANGGISYELIVPRTLHTISSAAGTSLALKVTFSNADTQIDSINIMYDKE